MTDKNNQFVKVLFRYHSDILDETIVETMWAVKINEIIGLYKLDSIPLYGPTLATGDEFLAEYDKTEQMLTFQGVTKFSENSVVAVTILKEGVNKETIRDKFKALGCLSEGLNDSYFSMEILVSTNYKTIKDKLDELQQKQVIDYAEPCLSDKHNIDIDH